MTFERVVLYVAVLALVVGLILAGVVVWLWLRGRDAGEKSDPAASEG